MRFVMRLEKRSDTRIRFERYQHINDLFQHYLEETNNDAIANLLKTGIKSATEAETFSEFVWEMVDEIVIDKDAGGVVAGQEDLEAWNEYVFESIRAYLRNNGYEKEWDAHV